MATRVECPECKKKTLTLEDGERPRCRCGYSGDASDVTDRYIEDVLHISEYETKKDGDEWPRYTCPWCERDTLVTTGKSGEEAAFICFGCGETAKDGELVSCEGDLGPHWVRPFDAAVCDACIREREEKDD